MVPAKFALTGYLGRCRVSPRRRGRGLSRRGPQRASMPSSSAAPRGMSRHHRPRCRWPATVDFGNSVVLGAGPNCRLRTTSRRRPRGTFAPLPPPSPRRTRTPPRTRPRYQALTVGAVPSQVRTTGELYTDQNTAVRLRHVTPADWVTSREKERGTAREDVADLGLGAVGGVESGTAGDAISSSASRASGRPTRRAARSP